MGVPSLRHLDTTEQNRKARDSKKKTRDCVSMVPRAGSICAAERWMPDSTPRMRIVSPDRRISDILRADPKAHEMPNSHPDSGDSERPRHQKMIWSPIGPI